MADNVAQQIKILYVEDDPSSVALVSRILESEGYQVAAVSDGLSAIETARREIPDLILMDINIGGLDGYEVTTRLRSIEEMQPVPIVAVTAATLRGDRERALIAGCTGYIPKPIDIDEFPNQVRSFLQGTREEIESSEVKTEHLIEYSRKLADRLEEKIRELEGAHIELQRIEKVKSDFIVLASHELRTPLTCVFGYVQMLLNNPDIPYAHGGENSPRELLRRIADSVQRLGQIFDEIRNISLIDADRLDLAREPVLLPPLICDVVERLRSLSPPRDVQFEIEGLEDLPALNGDEKRLHQALWNVISNSIKYTPDGGRISITGRRIGDTVHLSIHDTGVGIPREEQEHIFDRFYVLENTARHHSSKTAFRGGGLGLGLTMARGVIEAHGGRIWVESQGYDEEQLPGSTFHILLPVRESSFLLPTDVSTPEARFPLPGSYRDRGSSASD